MGQVSRINSKHLNRLDHLRVFACLSVIMLHTSQLKGIFGIRNNIFEIILYKTQVFGYIGVDMFFIISAFLFTILSNGGKRRIVYHKFLYNRMLRIVPLFFFLLLLKFLKNVELPSAQFMYQLVTLQFGNIGSILSWTIAVELKFYLILPVLLSYFAKRKRYLIGLLVFSLLAKVLNTITMDVDYWIVYYDFFWRMDQFIIGILLGKLYLEDRFCLFRNKHIANISLTISLVVYIFYLLYVIRFISVIFVFQIQALIFSLILISYIHSNLFLNHYINKGLLFIGKLTYGIYLTHRLIIRLSFPIFLPISGIWSNPINSILIVFPISIVIAFFLFKFIEEPFLKMKVNYYKSE